ESLARPVASEAALETAEAGAETEAEQPVSIAVVAAPIVAGVGGVSEGTAVEVSRDRRGGQGGHHQRRRVDRPERDSRESAHASYPHSAIGVRSFSYGTMLDDSRGGEPANLARRPGRRSTREDGEDCKSRFRRLTGRTGRSRTRSSCRRETSRG